MFSCFRKMAEKDREVLVKLNDIEHYIAVKDISLLVLNTY